jgi:tRNA wybutosine-synthesizing protein 2
LENSNNFIIFLYNFTKAINGISVKALRVSKEYGKQFLNILRKNNWLDTSRKVLRTNQVIELPVLNTISDNVLLETFSVASGKVLKVVQQATPDFKKEGGKIKTPFELVREKLEKTNILTISQLKLIPRKWELLGDVLVIKLNSKLRTHWREIAKIYAETLGVKAVLRRIDKIRGIYREPGVELMWGNTKNIETIHSENGVLFKFDPMKIMFSSGNIDERIRISRLASTNETIVDMFSGIGYFSLPIAIHSKPSKIIACELNPSAYNYLCQNIELNNVNEIVQPILGDNRKCLNDCFADRIIMGYIKSDHSHRLAGFKILKNNGGVIHYHDVGFTKNAIDTAFLKVQESLVKSGFDEKFKPELYNYYKIKSYAPKLQHVVLDIIFRPC